MGGQEGTMFRELCELQFHNQRKSRGKDFFIIKGKVDKNSSSFLTSCSYLWRRPPIDRKVSEDGGKLTHLCKGCIFNKGWPNK